MSEGNAASDQDGTADVVDGARPIEVGTPLSDADLVPDRRLEKTDEDRFNHSVIARRVAELVTSTPTRSNVALFGSWGSGKSSLAHLIDERLSLGTGFVYYDAWKYGGHSLKRNFISQAAEQLKLDKSDERWEKFYRGLYLSKRRARFKPPPLRKVVLPVAWQFVLVVLLLLLVIAVLAAIVATVNGDNVWHGARDTVRDLLQATLGAALVLAVAKVIVDTGRVDVEQSKPSDDEEFTDRFRELITVVRTPDDQRWWQGEKNKRPTFDRLVFFIDELDRCDEKEVVATLVAIRTFLNEDHCVFIVAADRNVLERALADEAQQATPTDPDNPYYTTAGAFLDKIFAHQLALPLLRGRRLTRFARDLVRNKSGLWADLVQAEGSAQLDPVIYALIPAHVRSPRRVKVLLNTFATNARVAEARGISWPQRAQEIAKLTALQTEFPVLAADLVDEPRLPKYLLGEAQPSSERAKELLARHSLQTGATNTPPDGDEDQAEGDEETEDPEVYLGASQDENEDEAVAQRRRDRQRMRRRHREQLKRYLERTAHVRDPQRDLLFLEAAGEAVGLDDPDLGELIEDQAPENPDVVVAAALKQPIEQQNAAARLLADMVQDTIDVEQRNVMDALMRVSAALHGDLTDDARRDVNDSLKLYSRDKDLDARYLPGALAIALAMDDATQVAKWADAPELLGTPERITEVAAMLDALPTVLKLHVFERIGETVGTDRGVVLGPIGRLEEESAIDLLDAPEVVSGITGWLSDTQVDEAERVKFVNDLLNAAEEPDLA